MTSSTPTYLRPPTFAEQGWYPRESQVLEADLERYLAEAEPIQPGGPAVRGVISPHAGYRYCGHVAGATYGRVEVPEVAVVLGVDHWHGGAPHATQLHGAWQLPLGQLAIQEELAAALHRELGFFRDDVRALEGEHSLEMQLPFLWKRRPDVRIVPLQLSWLSENEALAAGEALGRTVGQFEQEHGQRVLLVASTDLHHQQQPHGVHDDQLTREKDRLAIERIAAFDPEGLLRQVRREQIGMCGVIPTAMLLAASRSLGATRAELVRHATSAEIPPHNYSYVVGYSGFLVG